MITLKQVPKTISQHDLTYLYAILYKPLQPDETLQNDYRTSFLPLIDARGKLRRLILNRATVGFVKTRKGLA
jgi:hypothetical protein